MKKESILIIVIIVLALVMGFIGGKIYFEDIKNNKTEEKNDDIQKDENDSIPSENKITSIKFIEVNPDNGKSIYYDVNVEYYDKINSIINNAKEVSTTTGVGINNELEISYSDNTKKRIIFMSKDSFVFGDSNKIYKYDSSLNNFLPNQVEQIKKAFEEELAKGDGIINYDITSCEKIDSAGNLYIYNIVYDFQYNDKFNGADREAGTDIVKDKSVYVEVILEDGKYKILESVTGYGKEISAKEVLGELVFKKYLNSIDGVTDYRIKHFYYEGIVDNELVFHVVFDVQSNPIMDAGNGTITKDNWVENKDVWIQIREENGEYFVNKEKGMSTTNIR